jgi:threonine dehydrogenase-like Zn-dependent dehydrogenase
MRRLMAMISAHRVDLTPLVTHHFALDEIDQAFDLFSNQRDGVLKVALHPTAQTKHAGGEVGYSEVTL